MAADFTPFLPSIRTKLAIGGQRSSFLPVGAVAEHTATSEIVQGENPAKVQTAAGTREHSHGDWDIEIKRDGQRISQIKVQCRCGELIEIDCEY